MEITKALAALQPLYGKDNVEIITTDGRRVRGTVRSMKTTQALTTPSVKIEVANGQIVKIPFPTIAEIKDHNCIRSRYGRIHPMHLFRVFCFLAYSTPFYAFSSHHRRFWRSDSHGLV